MLVFFFFLREVFNVGTLEERAVRMSNWSFFVSDRSNFTYL